MRILVTGLDGFTGRYLHTALEMQGHEIIALASDLTDPDRLAKEIKEQQPEAVIHLAAIAYVGHGDANAFYHVNLLGTRNLLQALAEHAPTVKSILLASSANIYGNRSEGTLDESVQPDPANDYAVSKYAMEQMASLWLDKLPLFIVRPFNYTGVGQLEQFLIPKVVAHFKLKKPLIELGNLEVWREFGDVRSVIDIYCKLLDRAPTGETINICTGQTYSLREVISLCEKITGHNIEIRVNPDFVRSNEVRVLKGSNARLKSLINDWKRNYDLESTLTWMLEDETNMQHENRS